MNQPSEKDLLKIATFVVRNLAVDIQAADTIIRSETELNPIQVLSEILQQELRGPIKDGCREYSPEQMEYAKACLKSLGNFLKGVVLREPLPWYAIHTEECGTMYRGCSPDCPKDIWERTGVWIGPEANKPTEVWIPEEHSRED